MTLAPKLLGGLERDMFEPVPGRVGVSDRRAQRRGQSGPSSEPKLLRATGMRCASVPVCLPFWHYPEIVLALRTPWRRIVGPLAGDGVLPDAIMR